MKNYLVSVFALFSSVNSCFFLNCSVSGIFSCRRPECHYFTLFSYLDNIAAVYLIKHCKCAKLHFNYRATGWML